MLAALLGVCLLYPVQAALAAAGGPQGRTVPGVSAIWTINPSAPFSGQVAAVTLTLRMDPAWAEDSLVQLFQQELSLPMQVEAFGLANEQLAWVPYGVDGDSRGAGLSAGMATTLVLDGEVVAATSDAVESAPMPSASTRIVKIERLAMIGRPGRGKLLPPTVRWTAASSFREDFVQGRVPVRPERQEFRGRALEFEIQRLPETGRPLTFDGAIGTFELSSSGPSTSPRAGEPFDFVVRVAGSSVLAAGVAPRLQLGAAFTQLGVERKDGPDGPSFQFSLAANRAGQKLLPAVHMDFFEPAARAYALASTEPVPLYVRPAAAQAPGPSSSPEPQIAGEGPEGAVQVPMAQPGDLTWTFTVLGIVGALAVVSAVRRIAFRSRIRAAARAKPQVLMIGKYPLDAAAGDTVSVRRLTEHLRGAGIGVRYTEVTPAGELGSYPPSIPTLVHALNAELPATLGSQLAREWAVPLVVTTTGTDINRGLMELDRRAAVLSNLQAADCVLTLTDAQSAAVKAAVPGARVERITQGILLDRSRFDLRAHLGIPSTRHVALMLGGLRPVKGQLLAVEAWDRDFGWDLVIVGDIVDEGFALQVRQAAEAREHVTFMESLPHQDAIAALASADALLNTSESEGESRAILEAMGLGTPVLARRIPGNEALIEDGVTGLLFDRASEIRSQLGRIEPSAPLADSLRAAALEFVGLRRQLEDDQDALVRIYRGLIDEASHPEAADEVPPSAAVSPR